MYILNVIGAGNVGKTLATVFERNGLARVQGVVNQSRQSAEAAVSVIGSGTSTVINELEPADIHLIGTGDEAIEKVCNALASAVVLDGSVVFHCSGSLPSSLLQSARAKGAAIASVHPIKSFAKVETSVATFSGTFCGAEGDDRALQVLEPLFTNSGAHVLRIDSANKTLYHAAAVFAVNYFVALLDVSLRCYEQIGIERDMALKFLQPLLAETASNVVQFGPVDALTGPIARGDVDIVERQLTALGSWDETLRTLYAALGRQALGLSKEAGKASEANLDRLAAILNL